jgi:prophage regulatory protein
MKQQDASSDFPKTGFLRQSEIIPNPIPFSAATLWRKVKDGSFPAPVKLSERVTAWRVEDIRAWMESFSDNKNSA